MSRLHDKYKKEVMPKLQKELSVKNILAIPRLTKIVLNIGLGDAKENQGALDKAVGNLGMLAGQKPVITRAKKSISTFKLSKGQPIGAMATLRAERMYEFLDKLINVVLPKVRDFRGLSDGGFDNQGNFTLGLPEQSIFPEISYQGSGERARGLEVSIVTTAQSKEQGRKLLDLLGMPFKKN